MDAERLKEKAELIFDFFDVPGGEPAGPFEELLEEATEKEWQPIASIIEGMDNFEDVVFFYCQRSKLAFTLGFVLSKLLDPDDKNFIEAEKVIERVIRERRLFPYLPRERKAA